MSWKHGLEPNPRAQHTPAGLGKPQTQGEHRESAVLRALTPLVSHGFTLSPRKTAAVHLHSLSSFPILYLIILCSGSGEFHLIPLTAEDQGIPY